MPPTRLARTPADFVHFGPFRVDPIAGQLWREDAVVHLRPKTWEVLCLLVANAGQLLTKDDLVDYVWDGAAIGDTVPGMSIAEIRRALGDDPQEPRYIATVHRRGFRFVGAVRATPSANHPRDDATPSRTAPTTAFVGRREELAGLEDFLSQPKPQARIALISGEAGIGKTTLVDHLVNRRSATMAEQGRPCRIGRGQCLAHFGDAHPYLPVLGALRSMAREREDVVPLLRTLAPSWLVHLPDLTSTDEVADLRRRDDDVPQSRVVEEMVALLRALGPVVWVLEDLHWSDEATLELIALLAEDVAIDDFRLIATIRLSEAIARGHRIAQMRGELRRRRRCFDMLLDGLTQNDVEQILASRFPAQGYPTWLAERLLQRTQGNPFFVVHTIDHLAGLGVLPVAAGSTTSRGKGLEDALAAVPETLRELLQTEIATLNDEERQVLEAASLAGLELDAATAALGLGAPVERIDTVCTELARRARVLTRSGETIWPNGVASGRYTFQHALYQAVLYENQAPSARRAAHARVGRGLAAAYGAQIHAVAATVADHFERSGDAEQAVHHHRLAAREASRRHASREAARHLRRALDLLPARGDGDPREPKILLELGKVLPALREGFGNPELLALLRRARSLQASGANNDLSAIAGLVLANLMQHKPAPAEALAREFLEVTRDATDPAARAYGELLIGTVRYHQGDLAGAVDHTERAITLAPPGLTLGPIDYHCSALAMAGPALWQAGLPDEALVKSLRAREIAHGDLDPFNRVITLQPLAALHHWRGDVASALGVVRELAACIEEQGTAQAEACATLIEAWALWESGDHAPAARKIDLGIAALRQHGTMMQSVYLLAVAVEVLTQMKRPLEASTLLDEATALVEDGAARWWEPELHRWRAALHEQGTGKAAGHAAESCLRQALDLAQQQASLSLHLRAAVDLARLQARRGQKDEARVLLGSALRGISGGADTRDVRTATDFLRELGSRQTEEERGARASRP